MPSDKDSPPQTLTGVFTQILTALNGGNVVSDLDEAIREVTAHCAASQAKGKLTLELTIIPNGTGVGDAPLYKVEDKIKVSLPKKPRQPTSFFADGDNNLTRRNPNQEEMKLTVADGGAPTAISPAVLRAAGH